MAASAPSRYVTSAHDELEGDRFIENLNPWRTRLWIQQILRWAETGLVIGMICACLILLISRFIPWPTAQYWALGVAIGIMLCTIVAAIWYRPSFGRSARFIDARLALHDRISTALELLDDSTSISFLQRRDALRALRKYKPATTISLWPGRARLLTFGIVAVAIALLILLPNPMNTYLQQQAALQARLNKQISVINQTRLAI